MNEKPEALADRLDDERMNLIERLADENERLREEVRNWKKSFVGHVYVKNEDYAELISKRDALKTENERLREALEMIAGHRPCVIDGFKRGFMPGAEIAKAALRREET